MKKLLKKIPLIAIIFPPIGLVLFYKWLLNNLLKKEKDNISNIQWQINKIRPFFDVEYYLKKYSDVAKTGVDPLEHYLKYGHRDFYVALGYKSKIVQKYFKEFKNFDKSFLYKINKDKVNITLTNTG